MIVKLITLCGCERTLDISGPHGPDLPPEIIRVPMATVEPCDTFGTNLTLEHIGSRASERVFKLIYYMSGTGGAPVYREINKAPSAPLTTPGAIQDQPPTQSFREELQSLINKHSMENGINPQDSMLADYLTDCLDARARGQASAALKNV